MSDHVNHYAYHFQNVWRERAQDNRFDLQFRVFSLACGYHRRNGHATFESGQIGEILGATPQQVSNVIARAKRLGLIDMASRSRCLVVPPHAIINGPGEANEPCGFCEGKRSVRRKPRYNKLHVITSAKPQVAAETKPATITTPSNVIPITGEIVTECMGCKMVGPTGCVHHGQHWKALNEMTARDVERMRPRELVSA